MPFNLSESTGELQSSHQDNTVTLCKLVNQRSFSNSVEQVPAVLLFQRDRKSDGLVRISRTAGKPSKLQGFEELLRLRCATGNRRAIDLSK